MLVGTVYQKVSAIRKFLLIVATVMVATGAVASVEWRNLDAKHYRAGRKLSSGYLTGRVVLVDRWGVNCPPCRKKLPKVEFIWRSFSARQFAVVGGHCPGWGTAEGIRKLVQEHGLTFSIYENAGLAKDEPAFSGIPFFYVVDPTGKVVYKGSDERTATDVVVSCLDEWESPSSMEQWRVCMDFEVSNQPAHAILRHQAFVQAFPEAAKDYADQVRALGRLTDIDQVVKLVKISRKVADYLPRDEEDRKDVITRTQATIRKFEHLKKNPDPQLRQEAKNAIADLTWAMTEL